MASRMAKQSVRAQLGWTCLGSFIIFACVSTTGIVWLVSYQQTNTAMEAVSSQFRKEQAKALGSELAALLRPLFTATHRFSFRMGTGFADVLTSPANYERPDVITEALFPALDQDTHMRYVNRDRSGQEHNLIIAVAALLALGPDYLPTVDLQNCTRALFTAVTLDPTKLNESGQYTGFTQYLNASGPGGLGRRVHVLDPNTGRMGQLLELGNPSLRCDWNFQPLVDGYAPPGWWNFTWYGPYSRGLNWGTTIVGSVPILDSRGRAVGRLSSTVSLGKSVAPLLRRIIQQGGAVTSGGQGAVFSESGLVIGLSEAAASSSPNEQALQLEDVEQESDTGSAIALVRERTGTDCPDSETFISSEDRLVDIVPFRTEEHGLAPLGERWCQLMTVPRRNVFGPIDQAANWGLMVGLLTSFGFLTALTMLGRSLHLTIQAHRRMLREKREQLDGRVARADNAIQAFGIPMAVIHLSDFQALPVLECHEDLRDCYKLKFLDSLERVEQFREVGNVIVLISHQWLGFSTPDTKENTQLTAMKHMLQKLSKQLGDVSIFVWLDYISVPQRHSGQLQLAVNSLPAYVSVVDYFLVCAPDAQHRDTGMECNLATYSSRGWCRLEMLAKASSSGLQNMYICSGQRGEELRPYSQEDFDRVSLKVFEGNFTVNKDKESLVEPILGLYGLVIRRSGTHEHLAHVRQLVEADKEAFFPALYEPRKGEGQKQLFGTLVQVMEQRVASEAADSDVEVARSRSGGKLQHKI